VCQNGRRNSRHPDLAYRAVALAPAFRDCEVIPWHGDVQPPCTAKAADHRRLQPTELNSLPTLVDVPRALAVNSKTEGLRFESSRPCHPPSLARVLPAVAALHLTQSQLSALLMSPIKTIDLLYGCRAHSVMGMKNGKRNGAMDAILYGADGSRESAAMAELLSEMGVEFEYRSVNTDPAARREWEDLDGESIPMLRLGSAGIVRGLDRIKVQQLVGWVGC